MTTIVCGIITNDPINLDSINTAYEQLTDVPSVWIDVAADLQRPVMQRGRCDRAAWFDEVLPRCLGALQARPDDLDLFVTVEDAAEAAQVLALGGLVVRLSEDGSGSPDGALDDAVDLRGLKPEQVARRLVAALR
jgi:hypothetical protein